jgi:hypothetical protein
MTARQTLATFEARLKVTQSNPVMLHCDRELFE